MRSYLKRFVKKISFPYEDRVERYFSTAGIHTARRIAQGIISGINGKCWRLLLKEMVE
jgi:nitrogenase molybdenum-iron protein alpha/beta subunit